MHLVSRAVARVRTAFSGLPGSDDNRLPMCPRHDSDPESSLSTRHPAPEMWANFLASARAHGGSRSRPHTEVPPITTDDINSTLVGAYLLPPEMRQRRRYAYQLTEAY